jgi:hypothetical protein
MKNPRTLSQLRIVNDLWYGVTYYREFDFQEFFIFGVERNITKNGIVNFDNVFRNLSGKSSEVRIKIITDIFSRVLDMSYGGKFE